MTNDRFDSQQAVYFFRRFPGVPADGKRYVWAPEVHGAYNEHCYYFFVSAPDPSPDLSLLEQLHELMRAQDVESYSLYALYGLYDSLIRVWASEPVILRLTNAIVTVAVDDLLILEVGQVDYRFALGQTPPVPSIRPLYGDIIKRVVSQETSKGWETADDMGLPGDIESLAVHGLAFPVPDSPMGRFGIKFYSYLERRRGIRDLRQATVELRDLERAVDASSPGGGSTIYVLKNGRGFLVRGIARSFDDVGEVLKPVYQFCFEYGFRVQTFPIANIIDSWESDLVDAALRDAAWETEGVVDALSARVRNARTYLGALTEQNRNLFLDVLRRDPLLLVHDEISLSIFLMLEGLATSDRRLLTRGLAFVIGIEDLVREAATMCLEKLFPGNVLDVVQHAITEQKLAPHGQIVADEPLSSLTLGELLPVLGSIAKQDPRLKEALTEAIGTDEWASSLHRVRSLRNDIAHGRFKGVVDGEGENVSTFLSAARIFIALDTWTQNRHNPVPEEGAPIA